MSVPEQLSLDLPWRPALGREDFMVAPCNATAVALIDAWPHWPGPVVCLHGPSGSGKTHLAHVFKARTEAQVLTRDGLCGADPLAPFAVPGTVVVLENADAPGLDRLVETDLFHLLNAVRQREGTLLLTASAPPLRWPVTLPDLRSRLSLIPEVGLGDPDDTVLMAVLLKQFADRGLDVSPGTIAFLLTRLERRFSAAQEVVRRADALALREGKAITIPLVRRVLADM